MNKLLASVLLITTSVVLITTLSSCVVIPVESEYYNNYYPDVTRYSPTYIPIVPVYTYPRYYHRYYYPRYNSSTIYYHGKKWSGRFNF